MTNHNRERLSLKSRRRTARCNNRRTVDGLRRRGYLDGVSGHAPRSRALAEGSRDGLASAGREARLTRLAWCTDVHFNLVGASRTADFGRSLAEGSDACLLTGDIAEADSLVSLLSAFAGAYGKPVYFVLGNHDFYGSSFAKVRAAVTALCSTFPLLNWLGDGRVHQVGTSELCGVDGWYDAQLGDRDSRLRMSDFDLIADLKRIDYHRQLLAKFAELGQESAVEARETLARTAGRQVIFATHVPPYKGATWHKGKNSEVGWLPFMSNKALGFVLSEFADSRPNTTLTTLCGHTHSPGRYQDRPNHVVLTGKAEYGRPQLTRSFEL